MVLGDQGRERLLRKTHPRKERRVNLDHHGGQLQLNVEKCVY